MTWNVEKRVHNAYNDVNLGGGKDWRFVIVCFQCAYRKSLKTLKIFINFQSHTYNERSVFFGLSL